MHHLLPLTLCVLCSDWPVYSLVWMASWVFAEYWELDFHYKWAPCRRRVLGYCVSADPEPDAATSESLQDGKDADDGSTTALHDITMNQFMSRRRS